MNSIRVRLEDWQTAVLANLAWARGLDVQTMAERLLAEQIAERAGSMTETLISGPRQLRAPITLEQRLQLLFLE